MLLIAIGLVMKQVLILDLECIYLMYFWFWRAPLDWTNSAISYYWYPVI
jgi:hypothetical protein